MRVLVPVSPGFRVQGSGVEGVEGESRSSGDIGGMHATNVFESLGSDTSRKLRSPSIRPNQSQRPDS